MHKRLLHNQELVVPAPVPGRRMILHGMALLAGGAIWPRAHGQALPVFESALLVATPAQREGLFAHTVVLVASVPGGETIGVILNRALPEDLPGWAETPGSGGAPRGLFQGGPLASQSFFAVAELASGVEGAREVADGVYLAVGTAGSRTLMAAARGRARLFRGYSGWAPEQLAREVAGGYWRVREVEKGLLFDPGPESLWERLSESMRAVRLGDAAGVA